MTKKQRLTLIKQIIEENEVSTQEELTDIINGMGYDISQATISRDINELQLIKVNGQEKKFKYAEVPVNDLNVSSKIISLFKQITVSIVSANNLVVIKTLSGNGAAAGMAVDAMHFSQVLGSVAGDDTLLIITKSNSDAEILIKNLRNI